MSDVGTGSSTEPSQGGSSASANTVYAKASPGTKRIARVRKRHLGMLQTMLEASRRAAEFVTSVRYSFCSVQHGLVALSKHVDYLPSPSISSGISNINISHMRAGPHALSIMKLVGSKLTQPPHALSLTL